MTICTYSASRIHENLAPGPPEGVYFEQILVPANNIRDEETERVGEGFGDHLSAWPNSGSEK